MLKEILFFPMLLSLVFCFNPFSYAADITVKDNKIRIVDDSGYELVLDKPVRRVVGLYGPLSELMLALDMGHVLVGRTAADAQVEGLKHLPAVGTSVRPIPSRIAELKPDVVLQYMGKSQAKALGLGLRKLGIPVLLFRLESFEEMFSALQRLGKISGIEAKANELVKGYRKRIGHLRAILLDIPKVSVFYELRYPNLISLGSHSIITDILNVAGARNVIASEELMVRITEEDLLSKNPEAYIIQEGELNSTPKPIAERPHYERLQAVKNNRILYVKESDFAYPSVKAVDMAEKLAHWLHPKVNFNIETPEKINYLRK